MVLVPNRCAVRHEVTLDADPEEGDTRGMPPEPHCLTFAFPEHPTRDSATTERRLRLQEIRDGHAALLLAAALRVRCPAVFVNNPYQPGISSEEQEKEVRKQCAGVTTILLSTRPPLDDMAANGAAVANSNRKRIKRSSNWLETTILSRLRQVFTFCDRKTIELDPSADPLKRSFHFQQSDEAFVVPKRPSKGRPGGTPKDWTLAYFVRLARLWPDGPDLVCAFGLSGPLTLLWCHLLANRPDCADRIKTPDPRFLMAQLYLEGVIPGEPHFLSFAEEWRVKFLIDQPLAVRAPILS